MLGVKGKFMVVAALIAAFSSIIWGAWIMRLVEHMLFEKLETRAKLILTSYKDPMIDAILDQEMEQVTGHASLDGIIEEIISNSDRSAVYAYVTDLHGTVVANDNWAEYGKVYDDPLGSEALRNGSIQQRLIGNRFDKTGILDLALPLNVHGKKWGVLRAGFTLRPLREQLDYQKGAIFTVAILIFLVEMAVYYAVGLSLTRPLKTLATTMAAVDPSRLDAEVRVDRRDEIGTLQQTFRSLLERLRRSENERQRAVNSAIQTEKLAVVGKLVAGVVHEINNPLAAMSTCIFNLKDAVPQKNVVEIETMKQACSQIENIVQQLLDFNRAGQLILAPVQSDIFFKEIITLAEMAIKKKDVCLAARDLCAPPLLLNVDSSKLKQVAINILMNAAEASPQGGTVEVSAHIEDGAYCLAIKDSGKGIPSELQEKIFELFYSLRKTGKGNGIGLAISRNIVDMHCGAILLDSRPGETIFTVIIPLHGEQTA